MKLTDIEILDRYDQGQQKFKDIAVESGDLRNITLYEISFDNCFLAVDFRGANLNRASFINSTIKTCDFREANLTNAYFENISVEGVEFVGAIADGVVFKNGYYHGATLQQKDFDEWVKGTNS